MSAIPEEKAHNPVRLIKKYPNRRLYDTKTSSYITLADVKQMVVKQEDFQVIDAFSESSDGRAALVQTTWAQRSQAAHEPPQSTPVSVPSLIPLEQAALGV